MKSALIAIEEKKQRILEKCKQDIRELDEAAASLKKIAAGKKPGVKVIPAQASNEDGHVGGHHVQAWEPLPGSWSGMRLTEACHSFLSCYEQPVPFEELFNVLKERGVKMGDSAKPNRYVANLKSTLMNNRKRFKYDRRNQTVKLVRREPQQ
jgi:hypothetical protein